MTIEKNIHGYYVISDIINSYRMQQTYIGYSKRDAIRLFREEYAKEKKPKKI
jgi:hypothetical protein